MAVVIHARGAPSRPISQASMFGANVAVFSSVRTPEDTYPYRYVRRTSLCIPSAAWTQHGIDDIVGPSQTGFVGSLSSCCLRQIGCAQVNTAVASG